MKKVFDLGKIAYTGNKAENRVTVEVELREKEAGKPVFSASGNIWNRTASDIVCGGQCLGEIANTPIGENPTFKTIYRLWKMYHLNDMHPECEHQRALGWRDQAQEKIIIRDFWLTSETTTERNKIEKSIINTAKNSEKEVCEIYLSERDRVILGLESHMETTAEELPENIREFYKLYKTKSEARGWLRYTEFESGLLCKPCPVCGYNYGSGWCYQEIPAEDLQTIKELLGGDAK